MELKANDEQIAKAWNEHQNYAEVGRQLSMSRQTVRSRVMRMRAEGIDLPPSRPVGYSMTSERATAMAKTKKANRVAKT